MRKTYFWADGAVGGETYLLKLEILLLVKELLCLFKTSAIPGLEINAKEGCSWRNRAALDSRLKLDMSNFDRVL